MQENLEIQALPVPEKLTTFGLVSLPMLSRPEGPLEVKQVTIYLRKDLIPLYNALRDFLRSKSDYQFHLTGPPGAGKTSFVTLVCRMWVQSSHRTGKNRRVLYISYRSQKLSDVFIFEEGVRVQFYPGEEGGIQGEDFVLRRSKYHEQRRQVQSLRL